MTLIKSIKNAFKSDSTSGVLLFSAMLIALILANSPLGDKFLAIWDFKFGINTSGFKLVKPLILWINDGLMAIFFFVIGLEIKRELMVGELNSPKKSAFPLFAAVGGMLIPVGVFFLLNSNAETANGWGIPMATDIAFSLAILTLLGKRVPLSLKVFLTAFAIIDDLGAVLVIALFYSGSLKYTLLLYAFVLLAVLFVLSAKKLYSNYILVAIGLVIWYLFLKAGIHPTIAGVLLAFTVPLKGNTDAQKSPLKTLEHQLHGWVAFFIMPLFALSNSGVQISAGSNFDTSLILSIALGLIVGKSIGVTLFSWLGVKSKLAILPDGVNYTQILGIALLAGVGFTMSIFIANLAFVGQALYLDSAKLGILIGSFISGLGGYMLLKLSYNKGRHA